LKWRLVTSEPNSIAADDRYVAITKNRYPGASSPLTLIDQQTHAQRNLVAPRCLSPPGGADPSGFGGPWLIVQCAGQPYDGSSQLYNLKSGQWATFTVSEDCHAQGFDCELAGVGRYWALLSASAANCSLHCSGRYFLQSLGTGEFKPDPVTPGGKIVEDLDSPSGSRPLCSPLRYPRNYNASAEGWGPGGLVLDRGFALARGDVYSERKGLFTVYHLVRCGSRLDRSDTENPPAGIPLLSSRAMAWIHDNYQPPNGAGGTAKATFTLTGWLLPSLQQFTAALPPPLRGQNGAIVVALTQRTVYVRTYYQYSQLWAAALPPPQR
jgi:hypothetical protein